MDYAGISVSESPVVDDDVFSSNVNSLTVSLRRKTDPKDSTSQSVIWVAAEQLLVFHSVR